MDEGALIDIGLAGNAAFVTSVNPAVLAALSKSMEYWFGPLTGLE